MRDIQGNFSGSDRRPPPAGLYPLPLVPFECMALNDDWAAHPMTCGAVFHFTGRAHRELLDCASKIAIARHPLYCSEVRPTGYQRWHWVPSEIPFQARWIGDAEATDFDNCVPLDLRRETGLRMWVQEREGFTNLYLEFHHACSDGAGGLGFVEDMLALYAAGVRGQTMDVRELPLLDPLSLKRRGAYPRPPQTWGTSLESFLTNWRDAWDMAFRFPAPLAPRSRPQSETFRQTPHQRFHSLAISAADISRMRETAARQNATLNDVLTRDLFRAIGIWNQDSTSGNSEERLRMLIPMSLRARADQVMPAANRLTYGFVTRSRRQLDDATTLLASIADEQARIRRLGMTHAFLKNLGVLSRSRMGLPLVFAPGRCLATAVFSNLGNPARRFRARFPERNGLLLAGNLLMTGFAGTTALRPLTRAGFFVNTYGNQTTISARLDPRLFSPDDVRDFLDLYADIAQLRDHRLTRVA